MNTTADYPPSDIHTNDNTVNILQLTDLHLYADTTKEIAGINNQKNFTNCLNQALKDNIRCDLILITGDLVNEVKTDIYERVFIQLSQTGIPFAFIAGNHDVTDEINSDLEYSKRQYVAHSADKRLLSRHAIQANNWKILLLDSSVSGQVFGKLGQTNLDWLYQEIVTIHMPVIIVMHHHVLSMPSSWINKHITQDAADFWQLIDTHPNNRSIKAVITGHVHQKYDNQYNGIKVYATPSTCYQFKPNCDDFTLDTDAEPGYRWLQLKQDGKLESWVTRLNN